jgi:hypothetical protein
MIRCHRIYDPDVPEEQTRWAFLDTARNKFVEIADEHVFCSLSELGDAIEAHNTGAGEHRLEKERLERLATAAGMPRERADE